VPGVNALSVLSPVNTGDYSHRTVHTGDGDYIRRFRR